MNDTTPQTTETAVTTAPKPERPLVPVSMDFDNPVSLYLDSALFDQVQRVAKLMTTASLVPGHLRGVDKFSDCFLVVSQAFRWRMDPFAVAQHTFVLQGKLGYEGKLIAAVVNTSPRVAGSLNYTYAGTGQERSVVVTGQLKGEDKPRSVSGTVGQWKTGNEKWAQIPDQMLAYRGAREWARRHMPEAVLGIWADDEVAEIDAGELQRGTDGLYRPARRLHEDYYTPPIEGGKPAAPTEEAERQAVAAKAQPVETVEQTPPEEQRAPLELVDHQGELHTYETGDKWREAFLALMQSATSTDQLDGCWETNSPSIGDDRVGAKNAKIVRDAFPRFMNGLKAAKK